MKKLLGAVFFALPFVAIFAFIVSDTGLSDALLIMAKSLAGTAFIVACVVIGARLWLSKP